MEAHNPIVLMKAQAPNLAVAIKPPKPSMGPPMAKKGKANPGHTPRQERDIIGSTIPSSNYQVMLRSIVPT